MEFKARLYPPSSSEGTQVALSLHGDLLHVRHADGSTRAHALKDYDIRPGGFSGRRLVLTHGPSGETIVCDEPRLLEALTALPADHPLRSRVESARGQLRDQPRREALTWLAAALVTGAAVWLLLAGVDMAVAMAARQIPPSLEREVGKAFLDSYRRTHTLDADSPEAERVRRIGSRLAGSLGTTPYEFHFYVVPEKEVNAFAIPGGEILVYSELVRKATRDDELAGVLSHEIGHVVERHSLRAALHSAGLWASLRLLFGTTTSEMPAMLGHLLDLEKLNYSRAQEKDADSVGVRLAKTAGYDPSGLIDFFQRLQQAHAGMDSPVLQFISSHPMPAERIEHIRKEIEKLNSIPASHPAAPPRQM